VAKNNRRPQKQKHRTANRGYMEAMQELRRSSATSPVPSGTEYTRASGGARGLQWLNDVDAEDAPEFFWNEPEYAD